MGRMKLYVVDMHNGKQWGPSYLQRGEFKQVFNRAQSLLGLCSRVRRVKTPAERDQYLHLNMVGDRLARTEWVN